jgi:hypothetical protein
MEKHSGTTALTAQLAIQTAEIRVIQELLEAVLAGIAPQEIDNLPVAQWVAQRRREELEKVLIGMENHDAGAAAIVQMCIDGMQPPGTSSDGG